MEGLDVYTTLAAVMHQSANALSVTLSFDPEKLKEHCHATALASKVLPVPGGP